LEDFGTVALFSMGDYPQNPYRNADMGIDPRCAAAARDSLVECSYVAVGGMYDIKGVRPFLSPRRHRGGQQAEHSKQ
jgi:hypothetical protein